MLLVQKANQFLIKYNYKIIDFFSKIVNDSVKETNVKLEKKLLFQLINFL